MFATPETVTMLSAQEIARTMGGEVCSGQVKPKDPTAAARMQRYRKNKHRNARNGGAVTDEIGGEPHE